MNAATRDHLIGTIRLVLEGTPAHTHTTKSSHHERSDDADDEAAARGTLNVHPPPACVRSLACSSRTTPQNVQVCALFFFFFVAVLRGLWLARAFDVKPISVRGASVSQPQARGELISPADTDTNSAPRALLHRDLHRASPARPHVSPGVLCCAVVSFEMGGVQGGFNCCSFISK